MADIAFVAIALAFFALSALYVLACDRIVGRDTALTSAPAAGTSAARAGTSAATEGAEVGAR